MWRKILHLQYLLPYCCTGNQVLSAIYIEPPADVTSVPQNYTIHCITTGQSSSNITVGMFLERHGQSYYDTEDPPVLGYSQTPPLINSTALTYDYSVEVVWRADRTEFDRTEFNEQGLTKYNADHDWACGVNYPISEYDDLQTYIRGKQTYCESILTCTYSDEDNTSYSPRVSNAYHHYFCNLIFVKMFHC